MGSNSGFIPEFRRGSCKFGSVKTCQNYRFFDIFFDTLHKMKVNLGQERVKKGLLSVQGKNWNNFP